MKLRRSPVVLVVVGALALTACGDQAPPAPELAEEMIDTLEVDGQPVSDAVKDCMKQELADFEITEDGFVDLDDVARKAADGQPQALEIIRRFRDTLASCNPD